MSDNAALIAFFAMLFGSCVACEVVEECAPSRAIIECDRVCDRVQRATSTECVCAEGR